MSKVDIDAMRQAYAATTKGLWDWTQQSNGKFSLYGNTQQDSMADADSAVKANPVLVGLGYLEVRTRKSGSGTKSFKSVTEAGLRFGKNVINRDNPRETQPHWYVSGFQALLDEINDALARPLMA